MEQQLSVLHFHEFFGIGYRRFCVYIQHTTNYFLAKSVHTASVECGFKQNSLCVLFSSCLAGCLALCCSIVGPSVCCVSPPLWFMETSSWTTAPPLAAALRPHTCPTLVSNTCLIREHQPTLRNTTVGLKSVIWDLSLHISVNNTVIAKQRKQMHTDGSWTPAALLDDYSVCTWNSKGSSSPPCGTTWLHGWVAGWNIL